MIIYNVTVQVEASIAKEWLAWLVGEHIPEILRTGCFTDFRVVRLLEVDEEEGPTYAVQYHAQNRSDYDRYMHLHAPLMQQKSFARWGNRFIAFRSLMEVVH